MCSHDDDEGRYEGRMKGRIRRKMRRKDERKKGDQGWKEGDMLRLQHGGWEIYNVEVHTQLELGVWSGSGG